jgi:hypothetical protein
MMDVELKHHYGWEAHSTDASNLDDAAKQAVLDCHHFLTPTNHTMEAGERSIQWGGKTLAYRSVRVYRGEGAPPYAGPASMQTDYWFAVEYREPTL